MMKVFVYGTLMKGEGNHVFLDNQFCEYIGEAVTRRGYTLYDLGSFPAMVKCGNSSIIGEVYEVCSRTLEKLDYLEGHPTFYKRQQIILQDGSKVMTYLLEESDVKECPIIKSGYWKVK